MDKSKLYFYKGNENVLDGKVSATADDSYESRIAKIKDSFLKVLDNKNLSFLLGSGCSSFYDDGKEVGIPVMAPMADEFYSKVLSDEERKWLKEELKVDVSQDGLSKNLELFLSILHSLSFYNFKTSQVNEPDPNAKFSDIETDEEKLEYIILKARNFILEKCLNKQVNGGDPKLQNDLPLLDLYKQFYRKLLTRNQTLPRLSVFTTNYDLYSERAMDALGIHYVNGFTGGISKYFNPAIFNYALAEKMDLSQSKWNVIDNFFYLYKIHGSVNWVQSKGENKLFKVREIQAATFENLKDESTIMIHPTPLKHNASLGSPYSDLFREFQKKLMNNNNILVTIGYSFSDEHINNLIYQAFTIPSFRLIVIGSPVKSKSINELKELNDSRIWIIGEKMKSTDKYDPIHYFKRFVSDILPDLTAEDLDVKMEETISKLFKQS